MNYIRFLNELLFHNLTGNLQHTLLNYILRVVGKICITPQSIQYYV